MNRTCSDLKYILFISDGFYRMFSSLWSYVVILCFLSKTSTPLPASNLSRVGRGGERQGRFSSPLLRSRVAPESLPAGYLLPCSVYDFREVLCVEFLYCRIVTGSADGKVGLSILSLVFQCLFVLTLHRGPSNFLVRKREAPKRLYPQNSWFSVTVISRVTYALQDFFVIFFLRRFQLRIWNLLNGDCLRIIRGNSKNDAITTTRASGDRWVNKWSTAYFLVGKE